MTTQDSRFHIAMTMPFNPAMLPVDLSVELVRDESLIPLLTVHGGNDHKRKMFTMVKVFSLLWSYVFGCCVQMAALIVTSRYVMTSSNSKNSPFVCNFRNFSSVWTAGPATYFF